MQVLFPYIQAISVHALETFCLACSVSVFCFHCACNFLQSKSEGQTKGIVQTSKVPRSLICHEQNFTSVFSLLLAKLLSFIMKHTFIRRRLREAYYLKFVLSLRKSCQLYNSGISVSEHSFSHSISKILQMHILFFLISTLSSSLLLNLKWHKLKLIANNSHSFSQSCAGLKLMQFVKTLSFLFYIAIKTPVTLTRLALCCYISSEVTNSRRKSGNCQCY